MRTATKTKHILTALAAGTLATLELLDELGFNINKNFKVFFDEIFTWAIFIYDLPISRPKKWAAIFFYLADGLLPKLG